MERKMRREILLKRLASPKLRKGDLKQAIQDHKEFGLISQPKEFSTFLTRLARVGLVEECLEILEDAEERSLGPNVYMYSAAIDACNKAAATKAGRGSGSVARRLLSRMIDEKVQPNTITYNSAISACAKDGDSQAALSLFEEMQEQKLDLTQISFNVALIACKRGRWEEALRIKEQMQQSDFTGDEGTWRLLLQACRRGKQPTWVLELFYEMLEKDRGLPPPTQGAFNIALVACRQEGLWARARDLIGQMRGLGGDAEPNLMSYTTAMATCVEASRSKEALDLFLQMREDDIDPSTETCFLAMQAFEQAEKWSHVLATLQLAQRKGLDVGMPMYSSGLRACDQSNASAFKVELVQDMFRTRLVADEVAASAAIETLVANRQGKKSAAFLRAMELEALQPSGSAYEAVLRMRRQNESSPAAAVQLKRLYKGSFLGYARGMQAEKALSLFDEMHQRGLRPGIAAYNEALGCCGAPSCRKGAARAEALLERLLTDGLEPDGGTLTRAARAHLGERNWGRALELLEQLRASGAASTPSSASTALAAFEASGHWEAALDALAELQLQGQKPSAADCEAVLRACKQGGEAAGAAARSVRQELERLALLPRVSGAEEAEEDWQHSVAAIKELERTSFSADEAAYRQAINACRAAGQVEQTKELSARLRDLATGAASPLPAAEAISTNQKETAIAPAGDGWTFTRPNGGPDASESEEKEEAWGSPEIEEALRNAREVRPPRPKPAKRGQAARTTIRDGRSVTRF